MAKFPNTEGLVLDTHTDVPLENHRILRNFLQVLSPPNVQRQRERKMDLQWINGQQLATYVITLIYKLSDSTWLGPQPLIH